MSQPDLLKKTPLDSDSDGGKPDELTGPTTKTDLSGDVTEAAGREVTSPDPLGPPLPKYCGTCEKTLVESDWLRTELRLIIQGIFRPSVEKDCVRCWQGNEDKEWHQEEMTSFLTVCKKTKILELWWMKMVAKLQI